MMDKEKLVKDVCYSNVAKEKQDISICEDISIKDIKNNCKKSLQELE